MTAWTWSRRTAGAGCRLAAGLYVSRGESGAAVELGTGQETARLDVSLGRRPARGTRHGDPGRRGDWAYAARAGLRGAAAGGIRSIVIMEPDTAAAQAPGDIVRALAIAALVLLLIGRAARAWLSRSVSRPLARLAAATGIVARGDIPVELPVTGPTEVATGDAAFNAMAREVARGRETQRQLVADLRHDLRTPLTVIGGFAEALRDGTAQGAASRARRS